MQSGRQHAEGGGSAQAFGAQLLGDQGRPEQLVLHPVAAASQGMAVGQRSRRRATGDRGRGASVGTWTAVCRRRQRRQATATWAPGAGPLCTTAPSRVLHCGVHVIVVGCGRVGSGLAISLVAAGPHRWPSWTRTARPFGACKRLGRPRHRRLGIRPGRPGAGRRGRRRRPGRGDQRRQHQHPDRPHRPGDLPDPQRGGPDLRPPPGRDLPAPGHPHCGHGHLDHRPGPAPPPPRRGRRRLVGPLGRSSRWSTARSPILGRPPLGATSKSRASRASWP